MQFRSTVVTGLIFLLVFLYHHHHQKKEVKRGAQSPLCHLQALVCQCKNQYN